MKTNKEGKIVSWSMDESQLRDTHLNIIRNNRTIELLKKENERLDRVKQTLIDKGVGLYLAEFDEKYAYGM